MLGWVVKVMDDVAAFTAAVVAQDDELRVRVRRLANMTLDAYEHMMLHGTPQVKTGLMRSMIPALVKELREEKEDDSIVALRTQVEAMNRQMRADVGRNAIGRKPQADVAEDGPPE
jgi:hypothetical protein